MSFFVCLVFSSHVIYILIANSLHKTCLENLISPTFDCQAEFAPFGPSP